jgi:hypothetical protein
MMFRQQSVRHLEKCEVIKTISRKSKVNRKYHVQREGVIYKTVHRKLKIEQHEPHKNRMWTRVIRKYTSMQFNTYGDCSKEKVCHCGLWAHAVM